MGTQTLTQLPVAALVGLIAAGCVHEPWAEIDRRYRPRATRAAFAVVRHVWPEPTDEAADIAQEALFQAYQCLSQFHRMRPFWPWLKAIIRHKALDRLRRPRLVGEAEQDIADHSPLPEQVLIAGEDRRRTLRRLRQRLRRAVAALEPRERDLLLRFHRGGETVASLARAYQIAEQTVRGALTRAKKKFSARLGGLQVTNRELTELLR
jgi:RNA polymerase sigma factor (sigma-70 family)